jgi:hypothetical protein
MVVVVEIGYECLGFLFALTACGRRAGVGISSLETVGLGGWTARNRLLQQLRGRVRPKVFGADERGKAGALGMERDKLRGRGLRCLNPLWCWRNARKGRQRARSVAQRWRRMGRLSSSLALRIRLGRQVHSGQGRRDGPGRALAADAERAEQEQADGQTAKERWTVRTWRCLLLDGRRCGGEDGRKSLRGSRLLRARAWPW